MVAWTPKKSGAWDRMDYRERHDWLAPLSDRQIVQQAAVRARGAGHPIAAVLRAWIGHCYLTKERGDRLIAALATLASPVAFYDLIGEQPQLAAAALASLDDTQRFVFAASCGAWLGDMYATHVSAAAVWAAWTRAGLLEG